MKDSQIVILHGWTASNQTKNKWQPLIKLLEDQKYSVRFLLLPGLTQPLNESWDLHDYMVWLDTQLPKSQQSIIIGHSFGGQLAIKYAAHNPERLKCLLLIDSSGVPDNRWQKKLKRSVFWVLAKIGKNLPQQKKLKKLLYVLAGERDYYHATEKQKVTMRQAIRTDIREEASKIQIPTLILWGENDQTTPVFMGENLAMLIQKSYLQIIPDARHSPQYTHPNQVASIINHWIEQLNSNSSKVRQ